MKTNVDVSTSEISSSVKPHEPSLFGHVDPLRSNLKKKDEHKQGVGSNGSVVIPVCSCLHGQWEGWGLLWHCQSVDKMKINVVFCDSSTIPYKLLPELLRRLGCTEVMPSIKKKVQCAKSLTAFLIMFSF